MNQKFDLESKASRTKILNIFVGSGNLTIMIITFMTCSFDIFWNFELILPLSVRLAECLDLLEDMERRGLLDMNKVMLHPMVVSICSLLLDFKLLDNILRYMYFFFLIQVYHVKFFKLCRSQKAVKEAFRFCKLVQNPTLSTFNMLMSVCATSQNSAGRPIFNCSVLCQNLCLMCCPCASSSWCLYCYFRGFWSSTTCQSCWTESWLQTLHNFNINMC